MGLKTFNQSVADASSIPVLTEIPAIDTAKAGQLFIYKNEFWRYLKAGESSWAVEGQSFPTCGYLEYVASLMQSGTDAPVATVMKNALGGTIVWTRSGVGAYEGTLNGAFIDNKTSKINDLILDFGDESSYVLGTRSSDNLYSVVTIDSLTLDSKDGVIDGYYLEIKVYL